MQLSRLELYLGLMPTMYEMTVALQLLCVQSNRGTIQYLIDFIFLLFYGWSAPGPSTLIQLHQHLVHASCQALWSATSKGT